MEHSPLFYLNSNNGNSLLAFGGGECICFYHGEVLGQFQRFVDLFKGKYIFFSLAYDVKNEIENLTSENRDETGFPILFAWVPDVVIELNGDTYSFQQGINSEKNIEFAEALLFRFKGQETGNSSVEFDARLTKEEYIDKVNLIKKELQAGNAYEVNFCQEYYAENVSEDPFKMYAKLNSVTKSPFSAFLNFGEHFLMSGSPERFLKKDGDHLISQPIKGTSRRGGSPEEDEALKSELLNNKKERSENVMIVDLVRNDLSRIAQKGSVKVDELFGVYTFENVHQLISTISCDVRQDVRFTDVLKATFPMGSMTGAPKISAMEISEKYENFKRGIYSGTIGYFKPNGDFDSNVVIRSLIYNSKTKYLSCPVGGAITINSDPEKEYEECLVKVKNIMDSLNES